MSQEFKDCLIGFGANLGQPESAFNETLRQLRLHSQIQDVKPSQLVETRSVGDSEQPNYLNAAIRLMTSLQPLELLELLLQIEKHLGRQREFNRVWQPRKADLDILLMDSMIFRRDSLKIPHPRMSFRRFVLEPACEIAKEMIHPMSGITLEQLLKKIDLKKKFILLACKQSFEEKLFLKRVLEFLKADFSETSILFQDLESTRNTALEMDSQDGIPVACVKSAQAFEQQSSDASLVVMFQQQMEDVEWIREQAFRFAGPTLIIEKENASLFARELDAACQAMQPL